MKANTAAPLSVIVSLPFRFHLGKSLRWRHVRVPVGNVLLHTGDYNACMGAAPQQHMTCMEVWGGNQFTTQGVEFGGLDTWVYSKPYGEAHSGGDVYYASSCATGRISRLLV